jgi:hypothetical protein
LLHDWWHGNRTLRHSVANDRMHLETTVEAHVLPPIIADRPKGKVLSDVDRPSRLNSDHFLDVIGYCTLIRTI